MSLDSCILFHLRAYESSRLFKELVCGRVLIDYARNIL